nr:hypothetical protein Iba_chr07aCG12690 [Ipomoea batatas]
MNTLSNLLVSKEAMQEDLNSASKSLSATANLPRVSAAAFLAAQSSLLRNSTSVETNPFSTFVELRKQLPQLGRVRVRRGLNRGGEAKRGADLGVVVLLVENGVDEGLHDGGERRLKHLGEVRRQRVAVSGGEDANEADGVAAKGGLVGGIGGGEAGEERGKSVIL